jgi:hypothetical protein
MPSTAEHDYIADMTQTRTPHGITSNSATEATWTDDERDALNAHWFVEHMKGRRMYEEDYPGWKWGNPRLERNVHAPGYFGFKDCWVSDVRGKGSYVRG